MFLKLKTCNTLIIKRLYQVFIISRWTQKIVKMKTELEKSLLIITAKIVESFVQNNKIEQEDLPDFIQNLYADLYREIVTISSNKTPNKITKEVMESLIEKIETDKKYDQLAGLNIRDIIFFN